MTRRILAFVILAGLVLLVQIFPAWAGGWAVVTLSELPESITAGQPVILRFAVRQHGKELVSGLDPVVTAHNGDPAKTLVVHAEADQTAGYYLAALNFPEPGRWTWSIDAFGMDHTMPDLNVQDRVVVTNPVNNPRPVLLPRTVLFSVSAILGVFAALLLISQRPKSWAAALFILALVTSGFGFVYGEGKAASGEPGASKSASSDDILSPQADAERGQDLFLAKGCIICHSNQKISQKLRQESLGVGPDLTNFKASPEYLKMWLKDPASVKEETKMPNLELSEAEIDALIAFINAD